MGNYCSTLLFPAQGVPGAAIPNVPWGSWMNLVFIGLLFSAVLMVMLYMLSRALRIPRMEAWTRHEFFQILATAGLAIMAGFLLFQMCTFNIAFLSASLYQSPAGLAEIHRACPNTPTEFNGRPIVTSYCAAEAYLTKIKQRGEVLFTSLIGINGAMSYLFRITWESRPLGIGYTLEPLAGLQQIQNVFLVGVSGFMVSYLSLLIQQRILDYMMVAVPFYFMPLGLLLRCFAPTREFGGSLMGFCFASLLFFPLILVVNDVVIYTSLDDVTSPKLANGNVISLEELNQQIYGSNTKMGGPIGLMDLSKIGTSSHSLGIPIAKILYQRADLIIFQSDKTKPVYYFARKESTSSGDKIQLYQMTGSFDTNAAGAGINERWGMYEPLPDSKGNYPMKTTSTGTPIQYFTDPDPSASAPRENQLATSMLWPAQMVMIFSVAAVLMPIINFMIYIEIARGITRVIGHEMDLSNLTRMI